MRLHCPPFLHEFSSILNWIAEHISTGSPRRLTACDSLIPSPFQEGGRFSLPNLLCVSIKLSFLCGPFAAQDGEVFPATGRAHVSSLFLLHQGGYSILPIRSTRTSPPHRHLLRGGVSKRYLLVQCVCCILDVVASMTLVSLRKPAAIKFPLPFAVRVVCY